jgi:hypothetical protein
MSFNAGLYIGFILGIVFILAIGFWAHSDDDDVEDDGVEDTDK